MLLKGRPNFLVEVDARNFRISSGVMLLLVRYVLKGITSQGGMQMMFLGYRNEILESTCEAHFKSSWLSAEKRKEKERKKKKKS